MAIVQNPIVGRSKQKFGNAIFSKWKTQNTLRSKPLSVANPRSERQRLNRNRLTILAWVAKALRPLILLGFKGVAVQNTEYNQFTSRNYAASDACTSDEIFGLDGARVSVSSGTLPTLPYTVIQTGVNEIQISRPAGPVPSGFLPTDTVAIAVIPTTPVQYTSGEEYAEDVNMELSIITLDDALGVYTTTIPNLTGYTVLAFAYRPGTNLVTNTLNVQV